MRGRWRVWVVLFAAGCRAPAAAPVPPRVAVPSVAPVAIELPTTRPPVPVLDGKGLPKLAARPSAGSEGKTFLRLTESDCLLLAAAHTGAANALDEENRVPPAAGECSAARGELRRTLRYHAALELRNRAAADALDRYFQLTDAEARADLLRKAFPLIDDLLDRARRAKAAGIRFPLDPADLERQRSEQLSQLEKAELGSRLLNLDLKRRVGRHYEPADERLWPEGAFAIDPAPVEPQEAVNAALADRPELRALRALYHGLTPEMLPDARDYLKAANSLLGTNGPPLPLRRLARVLDRNPGPAPATLAEVEVRREQLYDWIAVREREVADEARAAALVLNAQTSRAALARDRLLAREEQLAEAVKKREGNQPGAELQEIQSRLDVLKAKAELAEEVAAWHRAHVKLKSAQGWLAWEAVK
jgi:hypothetical protein